MTRTPGEVRRIEAAFLADLWTAEKVRHARMEGRLPVPRATTLGDRLHERYMPDDDMPDARRMLQ